MGTEWTKTEKHFFESNYAKAVNHFPLMTFEEIKLKFLAKITRAPDLDLLVQIVQTMIV
jgi:hypothetical protein